MVFINVSPVTKRKEKGSQKKRGRRVGDETWESEKGPGHEAEKQKEARGGGKKREEANGNDMKTEGKRESSWKHSRGRKG